MDFNMLRLHSLKETVRVLTRGAYVIVAAGLAVFAGLAYGAFRSLS